MIKDQIQTDIITALKGKDETSLKVLRFVMSQIKYAEIEKKGDLTDEEVTRLIQKEAKKRKEAIEMFKKGGRMDLVSDEEKQIKIMEKFLPAQMPADELERIVTEVVNNEEVLNMGKIIGKVMARVKGQADGKTVADLVRKAISDKK